MIVQPIMEKDGFFVKNIHDQEEIENMSINEYIDDVEYWLNCSSGQEEKGIIVINDQNGSELGRREYDGKED